MKPAKTRQTLIAPEEWQDMPWGSYFHDALTYHLQPYFGKLYGTHLLKIGTLSGKIDTSSCAISHQVNVSLSGEGGGVIAEDTRLPFLSKSVDACLLAHTLSWSQDPHQVLRETDRVLADDGWIILSGFNPYSLIGLGKLVPGLRHRIPWNGRMFSKGRLIDWLSILNYEIIFRSGFQVIPWKPQGGNIISTHLPAIGAVNIIVARKRTYPLILNKNQSVARAPGIRAAVNVTRQLSENKTHDTGE